MWYLKWELVLKNTFHRIGEWNTSVAFQVKWNQITRSWPTQFKVSWKYSTMKQCRPESSVSYAFLLLPQEIKKSENFMILSNLYHHDMTEVPTHSNMFWSLANKFVTVKIASTLKILSWFKVISDRKKSGIWYWPWNDLLGHGQGEI